MNDHSTRRVFLQALGVGAAALGVPALGQSSQVQIPGFEQESRDPDASKGWEPVSDRKIRVGIVGYGVCQFGAHFSFQHHPNVDIVAVSDLIPERCAGLAKAVSCSKTSCSVGHRPLKSP